MSQSKRVYVIKDSKTNEPVALINASNSAQADRHFMSKKFTTEYAEQNDMFKAAKAGVEIENAEGNGGP